MNTVTVREVGAGGIVFSDGSRLYSHHDRDCCESHELTFSDLKLQDFEGLEFDLSGDGFFQRVEGFGIRLIPVNGHPVPVPGHGSNNGHYGSDIALVLTSGDPKGAERRWDVTECQECEPS